MSHKWLHTPKRKVQNEMKQLATCPLQGAEEGQLFGQDFAQRGDKLRNLSMRLDAAADQTSGDEWIRSHPDVQVGFCQAKTGNNMMCVCQQC